MPDTNGYGVIWDMDGTLVDTAELHFEAWRIVSEELGRDFARADFAATFGRRNPEIMEYLFPQRFTTADIDAIGERKEQLYRAAAVRQGVTLLPGVQALMEGLHQHGVQQAIGSSAPRANLDLILRQQGVANLVLAGITTDVCVHTTMREANDRGYECLLLEDCCRATDAGNHSAAIKMVKMQNGVFGAVSRSRAFIEALK